MNPAADLSTRARAQVLARLHPLPSAVLTALPLLSLAPGSACARVSWPAVGVAGVTGMVGMACHANDRIRLRVRR